MVPRPSKGLFLTSLLVPVEDRIMNTFKLGVLCCSFRLIAMPATPAVGEPSAATAERPALPKVGEPAPALSFVKLLQAPSETKVDWVSLWGKVVVLEFWSTRCGPCIRWMPHLNKIEEKFHNKPIVFISITDEDERTITKFLKKTTVRGWIALDRDRWTTKAYGAYGLPTTAIVGPDGKLAGWTHPSELVKNPNMLLDVLAGKKPAVLRATPREGTTMSNPPADAGLPQEGVSSGDVYPPLFQILIRPSKGGESPYRMIGDSQWRYIHAVTLRNALASAYRIASAYIVSDNPVLEDDKYDILFRQRRGSSKVAQELLRDALLNTFELTITREMHAMDVYILGYPKGQKPTWEPANPSAVYDKETGKSAPTREILERMKKGEEFFQALGSTQRLVLHLTYALGRPVLDEANIDGYYSFYFPHSRADPDPDTVIKPMREKYGLTLTPAKREVEVLVVE